MSVSEYFIPLSRTGISLTSTNQIVATNINQPQICSLLSNFSHNLSFLFTCSCKVTMLPHSVGVQLMLATLHRPQVLLSHLDLVSSITCTKSTIKIDQPNYNLLCLTSTMECIDGNSCSVRTSNNITIALQTFLRTSLSSSPATANKFYTNTCKGDMTSMIGILLPRQMDPCV